MGGEAVDVPGPVEHGQGLIGLEVAHVGVGEGHAAQAVGEDPGIGHDLVGVDQAIGGDDVGGRSDVITGNGILGLRAIHKVRILFFAENDLHDGVLDILFHGESVAVDVALEVVHRVVHVHSGGLGEVLGQEEVVAGGNFVEGNALHGVIHQGQVSAGNGSLGHGLGVGALPGVHVHIDLDIGGVVGRHLELDAHEGGADVQTHTEGGVHVEHGLAALIRVGILEATDVAGGLTATKGLCGGLGKADLHVGLSSLLNAVDVQESLGIGGGGVGPHAHVGTAVGDMEEVLTGGLCIELHPVVLAVLQGVVDLGGDGGGGDGLLVASLPLVDIQGGIGVGLRPGRHADTEGRELTVDQGAVGEGLTHAQGLAVTRAVLDGHVCGGGRDNGGEGGCHHQHAQHQCQETFALQKFHRGDLLSR